MSKKNNIEQLFLYSSLALLIVAAVFLIEGRDKLAENSGKIVFILFLLLVVKKIINYLKKSDD